MTIKTADVIANLLLEYEKKNRQTKLDIANSMEISLSNYYEYRKGSKGRGNPSCETSDKILAVIDREYPYLLTDLLLRVLYEKDPAYFTDKVSEILSAEQLIAAMEKRAKYDSTRALVLSGNDGNHM